MDGFSIGDTVPLFLAPYSEFGSVTASVRRRNNGYLLDFADNTFKASPATSSVTLAQQGNSWYYAWDTTGLNEGGALTGKQNLVIEYTADGEVFTEDLNLGYGGGGGSGGATTAEISALLTSGITALTTAQLGGMATQYISSLTTADLPAITTDGLVALSTASIAAIDSTLSSVHGAGSWGGSSASTIAAAVEAELSANHGAGSWEGGGGTTTTVINVDEVKAVRHSNFSKGPNESARNKLLGK